MPIIRCSECKAKVSDKALACPKCGAPIEITKNKQKSQISTGWGCLIVLLVVGGIVAIFNSNNQDGDSRTSKKSASQSEPSVSKKISTLLPKYEIVDKDMYDAPIKTQVELHAVVSGVITESGLKALLQKFYEDALAKRDFKYNSGRPTHVFIYLYTSREHFKSGMGQWIAMLSKVGEESRINTTVKTELISQLSAEPKVKHGLSESKRKEIFSELVRVDDRANREAEQRYPLDPTSSLTVGQTFMLSKQTPLMPEIEPADPMAALQRIKQLPPQTRITVLRIEQKNNIPWYEVRAFSSTGSPLGSGWINSIALMGQSSIDPKIQLIKQAELVSALTAKYEVEIAKRYGLTKEQLREISVEGLTKNWTMP